MSEPVRAALSYDSTDLNANNFTVDHELFLREIKREPDGSDDEARRGGFETQTAIKWEARSDDDGASPVGDLEVFTCEDCGSSFKRKDRLLRHLMTHGLVTPFVCPHCAKTFNRKDVLQKHVSILHAAETAASPFACDLCHKTFKRFDSVRRHKRSHYDQRDFDCHLCGARFTQTSILTRHVRSHTKEAPFRCAVCDKRYTRKYILARHVVSKHSAGTVGGVHACDRCNKEFYTAGYLEKHLRQVHKVAA